MNIKFHLSIKLFLCVKIFSLSVHGLKFKLHDYLTKQELKLVFNNYESMQNIEYEIFSANFENPQSSNDDDVYDYQSIKFQVEAFDKKFAMYLEELDHDLFGWNTPMYKAMFNADKEIIYEQMHYPTVVGQKIKQYKNRFSRKDAFSVYIDDHRMPKIHGNIQDCYNLRPVPENIGKKLKYELSSSDITNPHIIIMQKNRTLCDGTQIEWDDEVIPSRFGDIRNKRDFNYNVINLEVVYPQILVVVDYETFEAHNKDLTALAIYVAAFWNAVDLRFEEIKNPKIRLNIAGLIVPIEPGVEPYFKRDSSDGKYFLDLGKTVNEIGEYFYKKFSFEHDIVATMTIRTLQLESRSNTAYKLINGHAFVAAACQYWIATALFKDTGGFEGIIPAAHELAHLFGAVHDGSFLRLNSFKNISAQSCSWNDGYIMSYKVGRNDKVKNKMHWSHCSRAHMQSYLRSEAANCLKNKPDVIISHSKKLPGKIYSRNDQCHKIFPGYVSYNDEDCNILICKKCWFLNVAGCDYKSVRFPPAEGSSCGTDFFCLNGTCVEDPEIYNDY